VGQCVIDTATVLEKVNPTLVPKPTVERHKRTERGERSA
jgi:hypothetical protein